MTDKYAWNRQFRERILSILLDRDWYARFGSSIIQPEYFDLDEEVAVAKFIIAFYSAYNRSPYDDELLSGFETDVAATDLIDRMYEYDDDELDFAKSHALQFAKEQALKIAILESVDDIEAGILSKMSDRLEQALQVGDDLTDLGLNLKTSSDWAYEAVLTDLVPTGILHVDMKLNGGLGPGELGIIMAGTNVGKTMSLVNIGYGAIGFLSRCNVAHISAEAYANQIAERYAARTIFRWIEKKDDPGEYVAEFRSVAGRTLPGNVYIKDYPTGTATVADIDAYLNRLRQQDIRIDLLIVDYPGEMKHTDLGNVWENMADTYGKLRALAAKWSIPVWGAAQTTRAALSRPIVNLNDIGESWKAAQRADVVLAICQTKVEEEDNIMRFYAGKIRSGGKKGWMVRCHIDDDAHAIISEEIITVSQLMQEMKENG
ncbi:MAG: DnaB-like helicase C-terminal domain-containing protein [Candidatus Thorarchaeota archaeon]|jgi:replicative DNA helicase